MRYPPLVQEHFDRPCHAGTPPGDGRLYRGEAGSPAQGAQVRIEMRAGGEHIEALGFHAWGCPWTIAACSLAVSRLQRAPVAALGHFAPQALAEELGLPVERLGRLLILGDALRNCLADWDTTQPAGDSPLD